MAGMGEDGSAITPDDKGRERLGEQQADNNIERENRADGNFEAVGQRIIGASQPEDDQDRQSDPMPVTGERRLDAPLTGILIEESQEPAADIAPRSKDDKYHDDEHGQAIGQDRGGNCARRDQNADPGPQEDKDQNGKPV